MAIKNRDAHSCTVGAQVHITLQIKGAIAGGIAFMTTFGAGRTNTLAVSGTRRAGGALGALAIGVIGLSRNIRARKKWDQSQKK